MGLEMLGIGERAVHVPTDVFESLRALSVATDIEVDEHLRRALADYLPDQGHRLAVAGFGERARTRLRSVLDELADP